MDKFISKFLMLEYSVKIMILIGILGLLPFVFGLVDLWINKNELIFKINLPKYYGAIILTFLGSKYWGIILNLNNIKKISNQLKVKIIPQNFDQKKVPKKCDFGVPLTVQIDAPV